MEIDWCTDCTQPNYASYYCHKYETNNFGFEIRKIIEIYFLGGSQGGDLGPSTELDSEAVAAAKVQIRRIITDWLAA